MLDILCYQNDTLGELMVINGSLCNASCSLQQNQTSGRHVLHRVDDIVLQRKQGPSSNVIGDNDSDLLLHSTSMNVKINNNNN